VIDWMTAIQGHPAADVARTRLLLTIGEPPQAGAIRLLLLLGRRLYFQTYLETFGKRKHVSIFLQHFTIPN
jgi:aminoglycoside phosphotransferase (APT) family kinase protein